MCHKPLFSLLLIPLVLCLVSTEVIAAELESMAYKSEAGK